MSTTLEILKGKFDNSIFLKEGETIDTLMELKKEEIIERLLKERVIIASLEKRIEILERNITIRDEYYKKKIAAKEELK
jgi:hypothetical protein